MSFELTKIIDQMGPFALAIGAVLVVMALMAGTVLVERLWWISRAVRKARSFGAFASRALDAGEHVKIVERARGEKGNPLAGLLAAGISTFQKAKEKGGKLPAAELTRRELERYLENAHAEIKRGLGILASVGSVSPFIGLLGTVVGIITAFEGIAAEGSGGLGVVSAGIAEALVETALGLLVAIPSVLAFNYLSSRADTVMLALEQAKGELVDHLESADPTVVPPAQSDPSAAVPSSVLREAEIGAL